MPSMSDVLARVAELERSLLSVEAQLARVPLRLAKFRNADMPALLRSFRIDTVTATGVNDTHGNPVQWTYTVSELAKGSTGYGGWSVKAGGFSGTAYNIFEDQNDGTGIQPSTGVDHDGSDYVSTMDMTPLQVGQPYPGWVVQAPGPTCEIWLIGINGEDGNC